MASEHRREELQRWIAQTRRNQRILGMVTTAAVVVAFGLMAWRSHVGGIALAITVLTAIAGFWITVGHLLDWKSQLADLDRPRVKRVAGGGRRF